MSITSSYKEIFDELDQNTRINHSYTKEPNWKILIKGSKVLTASQNKSKADKSQLKDYAYIYDHQFCLTRGFAMDSSSKAIMPDGGLTAHELKIIASTSSIAPDIHAHFSQNVILKEVHLVRIITVTNKQSNNMPYHITAEYKFSNAYISGLISKNDLICLAFRYESMNYTKQSFDPTTGTHKGKEGAAYHNLVTGAAKRGK